MINFDTDRIIILHYPGYAGGKFLANCLTLSCRAVVQNVDLAVQDMSYRIHDKRYYQFKLATVLKTLPPDRDSMKQWHLYENGCQQFFGFDTTAYVGCSKNEIRSLSYNHVVEQAIHKCRNFFLIAHSPDFLKTYQAVWPRAKIIQLENYQKFQTCSAQAKGYTQSELPEILPAISGAYRFDIDSSYFDRATFLTNIAELYRTLGYLDFSELLVGKFYDAYMSLHVAL